eukprot:355127-Chlamydomonas_euryale.AAC.25
MNPKAFMHSSNLISPLPAPCMSALQRGSKGLAASACYLRRAAATATPLESRLLRAVAPPRLRPPCLPVLMPVSGFVTFPLAVSDTPRWLMVSVAGCSRPLGATSTTSCSRDGSAIPKARRSRGGGRGKGRMRRGAAEGAGLRGAVGLDW